MKLIALCIKLGAALHILGEPPKTATKPKDAVTPEDIKAACGENHFVAFKVRSNYFWKKSKRGMIVKKSEDCCEIVYEESQQYKQKCYPWYLLKGIYGPIDVHDAVRDAITKWIVDKNTTPPPRPQSDGWGLGLGFSSCWFSPCPYECDPVWENCHDVHSSPTVGVRLGPLSLNFGGVLGSDSHHDDHDDHHDGVFDNGHGPDDRHGDEGVHADVGFGIRL